MYLGVSFPELVGFFPFLGGSLGAFSFPQGGFVGGASPPSIFAHHRVRFGLPAVAGGHHTPGLWGGAGRTTASTGRRAGKSTWDLPPFQDTKHNQSMLHVWNMEPPYKALFVSVTGWGGR